jgi:hypothetical protein
VALGSVVILSVIALNCGRTPEGVSSLESRDGWAFRDGVGPWRHRGHSVRRVANDVFRYAGEQMQLTATFESWFLSDGTYPPLHRGQSVNLAFQLQHEDLREVPAGDHVFEAIVDAHYRVRGTVLRVYASEDPPVAVVECRGFRFYVEASEVEEWHVGMIAEGEGRLGLDYSRVTRIRRVSVPESFVSRS